MIKSPMKDDEGRVGKRASTWQRALGLIKSPMKEVGWSGSCHVRQKSKQVFLRSCSLEDHGVGGVCCT